MKTTFTWRFPSIIGLFAVPKYVHTLEESLEIDTVILDMSRTIDIHSAFIGFLIFAIEKLHTNNRDVVLRMSPYVTRTITMLGMNEYFNEAEQPEVNSRL
jgi:anti-anti-sigma regulatory factor